MDGVSFEVSEHICVKTLIDEARRAAVGMNTLLTLAEVKLELVRRIIEQRGDSERYDGEVV